LPPNTRLVVIGSKKAPSGADEDGFGTGGGVEHIVECVILPTKT